MISENNLLGLGTALFLAAVPLTGCAGSAGPMQKQYLFVWAADQDAEDSDFLAVIDANPASPSYGQVLRTLPVGAVGTMPHHTEHVMPETDVLFANGFDAGATFLIDLSHPEHPVLRNSITSAGDFTYPHSFERLPSGNVLATFQNRGDGNTEAGGLVEIDDHGVVLRSASAADPADPSLRPYSLAVIPVLDRLVSTTADMRMEHISRTIQVWRLSDLTLLSTVELPTGDRGDESVLTGEPRVLSDGQTVLVGTFSCGLYLIENLDGPRPAGRLVHSFPFGTVPECALASVIGNYWIQTVPAANALISMDVSDPKHPVEVDRLELGEGAEPHWISASADGGRIAITGYGSMLGTVVLATFEVSTGRLSLDDSFTTEPGPGVSFLRESWPHGRTGPAIPHGVVFSR